MPVADLSRPIRPGMPAYPGAPDVRFDRLADYDPDGYRERVVEFVSHTGTHLDAPAHMAPRGEVAGRVFPSATSSAPRASST